MPAPEALGFCGSCGRKSPPGYGAFTAGHVAEAKPVRVTQCEHRPGFAYCVTQPSPWNFIMVSINNFNWTESALPPRFSALRVQKAL